MNRKSEDDLDFTQSILNKTAEAAIATQLESAQNIEVDLKSKASQLVQGEVSSLKIAGEKIIAVRDIQLEKIDLVGEDLSLNLTQAVLGKISFNQPGNFRVKIVFTESDCDRLLNSQHAKTLLQNLPLDLQQRSTFYIKQAKCHLSDDGKVSLITTIVLNREQVKTARYKFELGLYRNGAAIKFKGGEYLEEETLDFDETVAMMSKIKDLLYLRDFANDNLSFNVTTIEVEDKQLIVRGKLRLKAVPESFAESIESVTSKINQNQS